MDKVKRAARAAQRQLKGRTDLDSIVELIRSRGYAVIFYDPEEEHPLIKYYGLAEFSKGKDGFTILDDGQGYVFVDKTMEYNTNIITLAHELGHIVFGHLKKERPDLQGEELEADTYAYILLRCPRRSFIRQICAAVYKLFDIFGYCAEECRAARLESERRYEA